jgi:hypothetical protein
METLFEATTELGQEYRAWKEHEKGKDDAKACFFSIAVDTMVQNIETGDTNLRTMTATVDVGLFGDEPTARQRILQKFPRFEITEIRHIKAGRYEAVIQEDPFYLSYTYVNLVDGMVYQRRVDDGPTLLDDERLAVENPQLYKRVTYELPWGDRIPIPIDHLKAVDRRSIGEYIYTGTPIIKLPAPRKAKSEELDEARALVTA